VQESSPESEADEKKRETTLIRIVSGTARVIIIIGVVIMILKQVGIMVEPMLAGVGIVGLAFGFGGQYIIRDILTGFFIIIENQYRIGDVVKFENKSGLVEDISLRRTVLRDIDGTVHYIPHGEIKTVSNLSRNFSRMIIIIKLDYTSDLEKAIILINSTGAALAADPFWREYVLSPPVFQRIDDFGDQAIILRIQGDTIPLKHSEVSGEFRRRIKIVFDENKIVIAHSNTGTTHPFIPS